MAGSWSVCLRAGMSFGDPSSTLLCSGGIVEKFQVGDERLGDRGVVAVYADFSPILIVFTCSETN